MIANNVEIKKEKKMGCKMSLKMHFLYSRLNYYYANYVGANCEHSDLSISRSVMKNRYQEDFNFSIIFLVLLVGWNNFNVCVLFVVSLA